MSDNDKLSSAMCVTPGMMLASNWTNLLNTIMQHMKR